jgi:hypothetical protein
MLDFKSQSRARPDLGFYASHLMSGCSAGNVPLHPAPACRSLFVGPSSVSLAYQHYPDGPQRVCKDQTALLQTSSQSVLVPPEERLTACRFASVWLRFQVTGTCLSAYCNTGSPRTHHEPRSTSTRTDGNVFAIRSFFEPPSYSLGHAQCPCALGFSNSMSESIQLERVLLIRDS